MAESNEKRKNEKTEDKGTQSELVGYKRRNYLKGVGVVMHFKSEYKRSDDAIGEFTSHKN